MFRARVSGVSLAIALLSGCAWSPDQYVVECGADGMCKVPAGSFTMGCNEAVDHHCDPDELPAREVMLDAFWIDRTEVTQAAFQECFEAGACSGAHCDWTPDATPLHPVACVTWPQAEQYCAWAGKRLPTEAEWEKAARGTDGRKFPWGNQGPSCKYAIMDDGDYACGTFGPWDVCSRSPEGDSPYGLCDMAGNVWELTADWYAADYYSVAPASNPKGPESGSARAMRGGGFGTQESVEDHYWFLRTSDRSDMEPGETAGVAVGFRCARSAL